MQYTSLSLHERNYNIVVRTTTILTLLSVGMIFYIFPEPIENGLAPKAIPKIDRNIPIIPPTELEPPAKSEPVRPGILNPVDEPDPIDNVVNNPFDFRLYKPAPIHKIWTNNGNEFEVIHGFEPVPITHIKPHYPEFALDMGIEGTVHILVFIDRDGEVQDAKIQAKSDPYGFGEAAIAAIMNTRFEPAIMGRERVNVQVTMPFHFKIR